MKQTKILYVAANPKDTSRLHLDKEIRNVKEALQLSQNRDNILFLTPVLAARAEDLRRELLSNQPNILVFSGHGELEGICLEGEDGNMQLVSGKALAGLFKLFANKGLDCVILNSCYSKEQAEAIVSHIHYVIGMNTSIKDESAIAMSVGFFDGVGAGESIPDAFDLAVNAIELKGLSGSEIPELLIKPTLLSDGEVKEKEGEKPIKNDDVSQEYKKSDLRKFLIDKCGAEEFETLCGDLQEKLREDGIKLDLRPEALGGKTIQMNAKNLIDLMERRSLMKELIQFLKAENIL